MKTRQGITTSIIARKAVYFFSCERLKTFTTGAVSTEPFLFYGRAKTICIGLYVPGNAPVCTSEQGTDAIVKLGDVVGKPRSVGVVVYSRTNDGPFR